MNETEIMDEIRSVFKSAFVNNDQFQILRHGGGKLKSLVVPSLSSFFAWTAGTVPGSSKSPIYILAQTNYIPSTGEDRS